MTSQSTLILLRHGESLWNKENRFTGWTDVDLTDQGKAQASDAGLLLREAGLKPDIAYTTYLRRAIRTLWLALESMDRMWLPVYRTWLLNERHYGALQGETKTDVSGRVGADQVHRWRRGFSERPPALAPDDPRSPRKANPYQSVSPDELPLTESLEDTLKRVLPYWTNKIAGSLERGQTVIIAAHGNSLRALIYLLDGHTPDTIEHVEVPVATPLVYRLDHRRKPIHREVLSRTFRADPASRDRANESG